VLSTNNANQPDRRAERAVGAPNVKPFPLLSVAGFALTLQLELDRLLAPEPEPLTCPPRLASAPLTP